MAVVLFGVSDASAIFLIFLASLFPILVSAMNGVRGVPPMYRDAGRNFGLSRAAYRQAPDATAKTIRAALDALDTWRANDERPAIGEVHVDPNGTLILRSREPVTDIRLGSLDGDLAARMTTFDATWRELSDAERAHATAIRLDTRTDHVTLAFTGLK